MAFKDRPFTPDLKTACGGDSRCGSPDMVLVSCSARKLDRAAPARDLYNSAWFTKARRVVEAHGWKWGILSTKYGLLHPQQKVDTYNLTMKDMTFDARRKWADKTYQQIRPLVSPGQTVMILAGVAYREFLIPLLEGQGIMVAAPLAPFGVISQMGILNGELKRLGAK